MGEAQIRCVRSLSQLLQYSSQEPAIKRVYLDAFAGSPISKVRETAAGPLEPSPFLVNQDDQQAQSQFILGSPIRALRLAERFHQYYFFDLDQTRAEILRELCKNNRNVEVSVGNCNVLIRGLEKTFSRPGIRGVAFLDPYGAHLEWSTLQSLARTGTMEVIINFPVAMAINRLITRSGIIPNAWSNQLDLCFGSAEWRDVAYEKTTDLFGDIITNKRDGVEKQLLELYARNLKKLFSHAATPRLIRNTRNSPLYYLIWAGPNKLGFEGADHILKQGEKIR